MQNLYRLIFTVFLLAGAAAGCKSSSGFEELSDGEKAMLVENARTILIKSGKTVDLPFEKKIDLNGRQKSREKPGTRPFSFDEKNVVKRTNPELRFYYTGDKEGRAVVSWKLSSTRNVILVATGQLIEKEKIWTMSVVDSEDVVVTPEARRNLERSGSSLIEDLRAGKGLPDK
ncbi:MAG: hypothetical protein A2020_09320 [Lentisphaerae bacterium GWF2_45_14]|nr:MAG: hypothetical protein A2020_09320 [Lentisphaerae bacterium GWF2_45_14]